jgi:hypothetical protein
MKFQFNDGRYLLDGVIRINGVQVWPIATPTPPTEINPVIFWGAIY